MKPIDLILLLVPIWLLTNFWLLPILKNRWIASDLVNKIARSSSLIVVEKIRDLAFIAVVSVLALMVIIWLNEFIFNGDVMVASTLVNTFDRLLQFVNGIKYQYGTFLTWSGLIGAGLCLYLIGKQAKQKLVKAWMEKTTEIREQFSQDFSAFEAMGEYAEFKPKVERVKTILNVFALAEDEATDIQLTYEKFEELQQELQEILLMLAMEKAKTEIDLNKALQRPELDDEELQPTRLKRLFRVLASSQFANDLRLVSRPLTYFATGLLIISFIGWAATPLANSLQLSVNNLRIHAIDDHVSRQLDEAISAIDKVELETNNNDVTDDQMLHQAGQVTQISRALAREVLNQLVQSSSFNSSHRTPAAKSEFVRAVILEQSYDIDRHEDNIQKVRSYVAGKIVNPSQHQDTLNVLVNELEHELKPEFEKIQKLSPSKFNALLHQIEARYTTSVNIFDAQSSLISQVVKQAFSQIEPNSSNELVKQGQQILKEVGSNSVKTLVTTYAKAMVTDVLFDQSRESMVEILNRDARFKSSHKTQQLFNSLAYAENTGWRKSRSERIENRISERLASNVANRYSDETVKASVRQTLGGYSALFPDAVSAAIDVSGRFIGNYENNTLVKSGHNASVVSRSTNFKLASRSFRVRGVLFGQEMTGENLDVQDIKWQITPASGGAPTNVSISLKLNGQWRFIGAFPAGIVNQAIRYAADQRVVATTITSGDSEIVRRVTYLHPALIDTPLGCRVIEADRFVDVFTSPTVDSIEPELKPIQADRAALYGFLQLSAIAERVGYFNRENQCSINDLNKAIHTIKAGNINFSPSLSESFKHFFETELSSPVSSSMLIDASLKCATLPMAETASCLCDNLNNGLSSIYWFPEDHTSQFREKPSELSSDLQWLVQSEDRFEHIDLWLHTTFALRKLSNDGYGVPDESSATAMDFDKVQLATLKQSIVSKMLRPYLINELYSPSADYFMAPLEQFLIVQRLARAAFNGQFGDRFPLEKLIEITKETRVFVPYQPTLRWETYQGKSDELLRLLADTNSQAEDLFVDYINDRANRLENKKPVCSVGSL